MPDEIKMGLEENNNVNIEKKPGTESTGSFVVPKENNQDLFQETKLDKTNTTNIEMTPTTVVEKKKEIQPEQNIEKNDESNFLGEAVKSLRKKLKVKKKPTVIPQFRDEVTLSIEHVMEEGLKDAFKELTPIQQQEFKIKGEEVAYKIRELLKDTHIKVKKIFRLILEWLKMLPGINRFFLEQEAKIKTDKIIAIKKIHNGK